MIREATQKDIEFIYPLLLDFFEYSGLKEGGITTDKESLFKTLNYLINDDK